MCHPTTFNGAFVPSLAVRWFEVEFFGKAAHASIAPWEGINALDAMIQSFVNINALRQSILPSERIHGYIMEGGTAVAVIPLSQFIFVG